MRKVILAVLLTIMFSSNAFAGWYLHCTNRSCVAEQGALKVYWMARGMGGNNIYFGKLTGVSGIPISIDEYRAVEKRIESRIEQSIKRRKAADIEVKAGAPEVTGGPTAGVTGTQENLFAQQRAIGQSKAMGRKVGVDYTLVFVKWLGDTKYGHVSGIRRYWAAAEYALDAYKNGTIEFLIERFFIARNAGDIENVAVNTELTDENKDLVLIKYIGLTRFPGVADAQRRYALASEFAYNLSIKPHLAEQAVKITEEFKNDLKALEVLASPGQTAKGLYRRDKELAFVKWLGNTKVLQHITDPRDRYIVALSAVRKTDDESKRHIAELRNEFEAAIKNKDESVQIVTIKGSPIPVIPIVAVLATSVLFTGAAVFVIRRKKNNQQEIKNV
jgi:hypothetical protein